MRRRGVRVLARLLAGALVSAALSCGTGTERSPTTTAAVVTAPAVSVPSRTTSPRATVAPATASPTRTPQPARVLAFTRTTGFHHDSIPAAVHALRRSGSAAGFAVDSTADPSVFATAKLARYAAVVFLLTTGDVLDSQQQDAFERYVRDGGGWAGVHSAADTEYDWPFYGELVAAYFKRHPPPQRAVVSVVDAGHPSTRGLGPRWTRVDEWYDFRTQPQAHVLLTVDERTYEGGGMGARHPIAWCHTVGEGRAWYTAMGHPKDAYSEPGFVRHVVNGVRWAAGFVPGSCD